MKLIDTGFFYNQAFFSVVPHKNDLNFKKYHFNILVVLNMFEPMSCTHIYDKLHKSMRFQRTQMTAKNVEFLCTSGYVIKEGGGNTTRYHLHSKGYLLLAQVERQYKLLIKQAV